MSFFLTLIIIGLFLRSFAYSISQTANKMACKKHKWEYRNQGTDQEYMICISCQMVPGKE